MLDEHVDFFKAVRVEQKLNALAGGQLAAAVLRLNPLFTPAEPCFAAAVFNSWTISRMMPPFESVFQCR